MNKHTNFTNEIKGYYTGRLETVGYWVMGLAVTYFIVRTVVTFI